MARFEKIAAQEEHDGQVLRLVLNAPRGNVLDRAMLAELTRAVEELGTGRDVKALIFEGTGEHFSFGASVEEHRKESVGVLLATFHGMFRALVACGRPMLALVRGQCLGGGLELASFCHWIFAANDAEFGQPEINLGLFPPAASLILPQRIGQSAADDLVLTGRSIAADEAQRIGLVHSVSADPARELDAFLARWILPKSATSLHFAARASRQAMHASFLAHIETQERIYLQGLMETRDAGEGIRSFLEKRKPVWENR